MAVERNPLFSLEGAARDEDSRLEASQYHPFRKQFKDTCIFELDTVVFVCLMIEEFKSFESQMVMNKCKREKNEKTSMLCWITFPQNFPKFLNIFPPFFWLVFFFWR